MDLDPFLCKGPESPQESPESDHDDASVASADCGGGSKSDPSSLSSLSSVNPTDDLPEEKQLEMDARREEEMESMVAILGDDFCRTPAGADINFFSSTDPAVRRSEAPACLSLTIPAGYPAPGFVLSFDLGSGTALRRAAAAELLPALDEVAYEHAQHGEEAMYALVSIVQDAVNEQLRRAEAAGLAGGAGAGAGADGAPEAHKRDPMQYVGKLSDILKEFPREYGVTKIETVLRDDLAEEFDATQRGFPSEARKITTAFHGTDTSVVHSIVQQGLLVPGKDNDVKVATGSRFGRGVYVSPNPLFASMYARRSTDPDRDAAEKKHAPYRLVVCATLLGRINTAFTFWSGLPTGSAGFMRGYRPGRRGKAFHSLQAGPEHARQYVVYRKQQILPVYIIYFDMVRREGTMYHEVSSGGTHMLVAGNRRDEEAVLAEMRSVRRAARIKNAEFFLGRGVKVLDLADDECAEDDDDTTAFSFNVCKTLAGLECGDETGLYQNSRYSEDRWVEHKAEKRRIEHEKELSRLATQKDIDERAARRRGKGVVRAGAGGA